MSLSNMRSTHDFAVGRTLWVERCGLCTGGGTRLVLLALLVCLLPLLVLSLDLLEGAGSCWCCVVECLLHA